MKIEKIENCQLLQRDKNKLPLNGKKCTAFSFCKGKKSFLIIK